MTVESMVFRLSIPKQSLLTYYQGAASQVTAIATDGRRLRFPAESLRRFVTHEGVQGLFEIRFGANHKLIDLRRIND
jgi:hypothetical protein